MSRIQKMQENNSVDGTFCLFLKQKLDNFKQSSNRIVVVRPKCNQRPQISNRGQPQLKASGIKLSKNLFSNKDKQQNLSTNCQTYRLPSKQQFFQSLHTNKFISYNFANQFFQQNNKILNNNQIYFIPSQFYYQNNVKVTKLPKNVQYDHIKQSKITRIQINKNLANTINNSDKISSPLSTTLQQTKKQHQQIKNNQNRGLNLIDFSCVRKVQTLNSSESFSISFQYMQSQLDLRQMQRQVDYNYIERQMKKLLQN